MRALPIRITDKRIRGLVKLGYLGPNELKDMRAIEQAMNLFVWDELEKLDRPKQTNCATN